MDTTFADLAYGKISSYSGAVPRRKPGTLLPLELEILDVALSQLRAGHATFHGFGLAQTMREHRGSRSLTAHGTLYKALSRLEDLGLLTSRWEDAASVDRRPRRRLYEIAGQRSPRWLSEPPVGKPVAPFPRLAPETR